MQKAVKEDECRAGDAPVKSLKNSAFSQQSQPSAKQASDLASSPITYRRQVINSVLGRLEIMPRPNVDDDNITVPQYRRKANNRR